MPTTDDEQGRRVTPGTELLTLRAENERLKAYLARVLEVLEARVDDLAPGPVTDEWADDDITVLDDGVPAAPAVSAARAKGKGLMVIGDSAPAVVTDAGLQGEAIVDVADRLATVQQDLARVESHVETLLWRLGERRSTFAAGS